MELLVFDEDGEVDFDEYNIRLNNMLDDVRDFASKRSNELDVPFEFVDRELMWDVMKEVTDILYKKKYNEYQVNTTEADGYTIRTVHL